MKRLYAVICADVVESTSLDIDSLVTMRQVFNDTFADIRGHLRVDFWARLIKGDYIECCCDSPALALRIAMILKCRLKWWAEAFNCGGERLRTLGLRFSIGVGQMRIIDPQRDIMDGEAIYAAGRGLNRLSNIDATSCFSFVNSDDSVEGLMDNNVNFIDEYINSMSARQCAVVYYKLLGFLEKDIAEILHLSQPAVNMRAKLASWPLINKALSVIDNVEYGKYVF